MNTRQIEYIIEIAEQKNMQRAAERLFVSQSTLSQALIKLEKELNCQLFIRNAREMVLTREGEAYVQGGKEILETKKRTYETIRQLSNNILSSYRIGISSHEGMERFLVASSDLQKAWNDLEIYAIEDNFKNLMEKLQKKILNLVIVTWHTVTDIQLPYRVLNCEEINLVAQDDWCPRGGFVCENSVCWEQLRGEKLILPNPGSTIRSMVDSTLSKLDIKPKISCEISSVSTTLKMVEKGAGLAFLPRNLLLGREGYQFLSLTPPLTRYLIAIYNRESENDEILQHFIQLLLNCSSS